MKQNATFKGFALGYKELASISELHTVQVGELA
jgi:hypothetical protein